MSVPVNALFFSSVVHGLENIFDARDKRVDPPLEIAAFQDAFELFADNLGAFVHARQHIGVHRDPIAAEREHKAS